MPRALVLIFTALLLAPAPAAAWVRTTNGNGIPVEWRKSNCLVMRIDNNGSDDIKDYSEIGAARKAWTNWRNATKSCSYLTFIELPTAKGLTPGYNKDGVNENIISWVETGWTHTAFAVALTKISFVERSKDPGSGQDGRILDADIILNGQHLRFATDGNTKRHDVENTLTHELGHALGMDHPCDDGTYSTIPKDNNGKTIPKCGSASTTQAMKDSTMYNFTDLGETKKRSLTSDDINSICAVYPQKNDPGECKAVDIPAEYDDSGCAIAPRSRLPLSLLWLLALALPFARARSRRT